MHWESEPKSLISKGPLCHFSPYQNNLTCCCSGMGFTSSLSTTDHHHHHTPAKWVIPADTEIPDDIFCKEKLKELARLTEAHARRKLAIYISLCICLVLSSDSLLGTGDPEYCQPETGVPLCKTFQATSASFL